MNAEQHTTIVIRAGALALACTLVGYAVYELALLPDLLWLIGPFAFIGYAFALAILRI